MFDGEDVEEMVADADGVCEGVEPGVPVPGGEMEAVPETDTEDDALTVSAGVALNEGRAPCVKEAVTASDEVADCVETPDGVVVSVGVHDGHTGGALNGADTTPRNTVSAGAPASALTTPVAVLYE